MNETAWRAEVIRHARTFGWAAWYTSYSPYSTPGWPDLALARPPRVLLTELKTDHPRSKRSSDQEAAAEVLGACEVVEYHLWRPSAVEDVIETLRAGRPGTDQLRLRGL